MSAFSWEHETRGRIYRIELPPSVCSQRVPSKPSGVTRAHFDDALWPEEPNHAMIQFRINGLKIAVEHARLGPLDLSLVGRHNFLEICRGFSIEVGIQRQVGSKL